MSLDQEIAFLRKVLQLRDSRWSTAVFCHHILPFMLASSARNVLQKPTKQLFRFRGCLVTKREAHRTAPRSSHRTSSTQAIPTIPASEDDKNLITLFDLPKSTSQGTVVSTTGLFGHRSLTHPRALISLTDATLVRSRLLADRILRARESRSELLKVVKNLDRLSDMLCGVIDLAELVRNAHPDRAWVEAANHAYESLCEFMNVLNTHVGLYEVRSLFIRVRHSSNTFLRFSKLFYPTPVS